jgi:hypothetical protein
MFVRSERCFELNQLILFLLRFTGALSCELLLMLFFLWMFFFFFFFFFLHKTMQGVACFVLLWTLSLVMYEAVKSRMSSHWAALLTGFVFYEFAFWIVVFLERFLPRHHSHREPLFVHMAFVSALNQFSQICCVVVAFFLLHSEPQRSIASWYGGVITAIIEFCMYDILFYLGHRLLHTSMFSSFHALHHSSHATSAVSGHYMSAVRGLITNKKLMRE